MGIILVLVSALFFVLGTFFGKIVTNISDMSAVVTSFARMVIGTAIMGLYIINTKRSFAPNDFRTVYYRGVLNGLSILTSSWAIKFTTVTNSTMLHMTYPVFVVILAPFITKEKVEKKNYIYLFLIMAGIYLVTNPIFTKVSVGDIGAIISAIFSALSIFALTEASNKNESYIIVFYVMLIGALINLPFAAKNLLNFEMIALVPVLLSAICGFLGQVFLTWGYRYVDSSTGSIVSTSRIIISAFMGIMFLSEPFTLRILSGMFIVIVSLIGVSGIKLPWLKARTDNVNS